jgi:hypothetical protein
MNDNNEQKRVESQFRETAMSPEQEIKSYHELRKIVDQWSILGIRRYTGGTLRIGHIPHVAIEGYLHLLLPPISDQGIEALKTETGLDIPYSLQRLLKIHNGIEIFDYVTLFGLRTSYKRSDMDAMMEQPFNMVTPNTKERPDAAPSDFLFVGSLGDDRLKVGLWPDGEVGYWDKKTQTVVPSGYYNVFEFLLEETRKAERLFDEKGRRIDHLNS